MPLHLAWITLHTTCQVNPCSSTGTPLEAALRRRTTARAICQALDPERMSWGTRICILSQNSNSLALLSSPSQLGLGPCLSHSRPTTLHLRRMCQLFFSTCSCGSALPALLSCCMQSPGMQAGSDDSCVEEALRPAHSATEGHARACAAGNQTFSRGEAEGPHEEAVRALHEARQRPHNVRHDLPRMHCCGHNPALCRQPPPKLRRKDHLPHVATLLGYGQRASK